MAMEQINDIAILGGGAAGLLCALELAPSGKSILILEREIKNSDDRTWSYWEKGAGKLDHLLQREWPLLNFYGNAAIERVDMNPFTYKMIRSSRFYAFAHEKLASYHNVQRVQSEIVAATEVKDKVQIKTSSGDFYSKLVLDSVFLPNIDHNKHQYVSQHFGGWYVETEQACFQEDTATLMDFRVDQMNETRFFYVLPFTKSNALIEMATFSNEIMSMDEYDTLIGDYMAEFYPGKKYKVKEREYGVIPMTSYPFHKHNSERIIKIGTAGGWVKPSSGYAFSRTVKRAEELALQLASGSKIDVSSDLRHRWMDATLLKAILKNYVSCKDVFESLFSKRDPAEVFEFLDEESSFFQELKVMYSCPIVPLTRAALIP